MKERGEKEVAKSITEETWSKFRPPSGEDTFPKLLKRNYLKWGDQKVAYRYKDYGYWRELTWKDFYERTKWLAGGLASIGFGLGNKIAICGENAPEWFWGQTAAQWLQQGLSLQRSEHLSQFSNVTQQEAQALADAEYAQRARTFLVAHGVCEGNPNLRVGSYLKLNGLGPRFSNTYYTTATVHRFDTQKGYETRFSAECAYLGGATS
jgi:hypothetical protein